jgi:hypothetical protein
MAAMVPLGEAQFSIAREFQYIQLKCLRRRLFSLDITCLTQPPVLDD